MDHFLYGGMLQTVQVPIAKCLSNKQRYPRPVFAENLGGRVLELPP